MQNHAATLMQRSPVLWLCLLAMVRLYDAFQISRPNRSCKSALSI